MRVGLNDGLSARAQASIIVAGPATPRYAMLHLGRLDPEPPLSQDRRGQFMLRMIRHRLGTAWWRLKEPWRRRRDKRLAAAARAVRETWADAALDRLPPLPDMAGDARFEFHTTSGEDQAAMGIWSSWSLLRFFPEARLVVHSDGDLTSETAARWRRVVPGARFIARQEDLAAMQARLAGFPHVLEWCRRYHFGSKLGGVFSTAQAQKVVDFDTDTLTLREPVALRRFLDTPDWRLAWNRDHAECYAYPAQILRAALDDPGAALLGRFNGGFMASVRLEDAEWAFLDRTIVRLSVHPGIDPLRTWMHQTLWAILGARFGAGAQALPPDFDIYFGPTRPGTTMRHFVGAPETRPRFFTEGLPILLGDARARGQVPANFAAGLQTSCMRQDASWAGL